MTKWTILLVIIGLITSFLIYSTIDEKAEVSLETENLIEIINTEPLVIENINIEKPKPLIYAPINEFQERITKKPYGIYITPATSPVQPEIFSGYHTGVDVEYEDVEDDVDVFAIADGQVVAARIVSGYGGVLIIKHNLNGENILALYGHLDQESMTTINSEVTAGQKIAVLGEGYTDETDGERKHLHFGIIKGETISYKGYVSTEAQLEAWIDPLIYY